MTMQIPDMVIFKDEEYYLLDIEKGKKIFDYDSYIKESNFPISISSACWRGYTMEYSIINGSLFLTLLNDGECNEKLEFSGGIFIVKDEEHYNTDFLTGVFGFRCALELIFDKGILIKSHNLKAMLDEFNGLEEDIIGYAYQEKANEILKKHCLIKYEENNYKWRD